MTCLKRMAFGVFFLPGFGLFAQTSAPVAVLGVVPGEGAPLASELVNAPTGALSLAQVYAGPFNAVAVHPGGRFVYAAGGATGTMLYAATIDPANGALTSIPGSPYSVLPANPTTLPIASLAV